MLLFSNLQLISFNIFFLLISITKQNNKPRGITNKDNQPINKGLPRNNSINPIGTNIRRARSINGKMKLPLKPILITFDDGYYSNYEYIYPILKKYNVKVSIFIVTDKIGKEISGIKYLDWKECIEMKSSGLVGIFSHGKKHVFYDKLSVREIRDDVIESYKIIEKNLGKTNLKVFAYPYGAYTNDTVIVLKNNGIDFQLYDLGINYFDSFNKNFIKRINVPCEMTGREIIEEIQKNDL